MAAYLTRVYISYKPTVNDPQGLTIRDGLHMLGFTEVTGVRAGKYIEIRLEAENAGQAAEQVEAMCQQLLANPVIEEFRFDLEPAEPGKPPAKRSRKA